MKTIHDPNLVFYADLAKHDGGLFMDKSAYGHLCTVTGATWGSQGRTFAGGDDFIDCGNIVNVSPDLSILCWMNAGALEDKAFVAKYDGTLGRQYLLGSSAVAIGADHPTKFRVRVSKDGGTTNFKSYSSSFVSQDNTFHMVGFTHAAGTLSLYMDESLDPNPVKTTDGDTSTIHTTGTDTLKIGASTSTPTSFFTGTIGEVLVYNRALTPLEIQNIYLATKWRYR